MFNSQAFSDVAETLNIMDAEELVEFSIDSLGLNDTLVNVTVGNVTSMSTRHVSILGQVLITFFYGFGISANVCALVLLYKGETARNRKQTLMVRCLACNDLVALLGSFMLMYMQLYMSKPLVDSRWFCALRVVLRTFGLSSGCVAIVMAAERWMALTRPFLYQKHVTHALIKRAIFTLWMIALFLVCLPFTGFGLYYDESTSITGRSRCKRYRSASELSDIVYAFVVFAFGCWLCLVIVCCNLAVVRALCRMGRKSLAHCGRTTVRKDSRELSFNHTTPEELSFAKLMVILCIFFVACWVPQMVTIIMAQMHPENPSKPHPFYRIADICMALNFTLDPVVYVLSRRPHRRGLRKLMKPLCQSCWPQDHRTPSMRSSQEGSKITKELNQHSLSHSSQKDCIILEQMNKMNPKLRIIFNTATSKKANGSQPSSLKDDSSNS
ncbi:prostaglandin E2 receptor EP3 subtype-like isoform X2 [Parasteatoda tepidariorum]|uniref:prostaglandin E2 receptor EP3 subtype-like isoform X2 n=1 Tax=Parasteatoda tepidariorum TaxID=114398 RepID=UPI00077F9136|nr:prostaglandin D2 receptor-like isoform X2 [Parasteatoda tepidariorum]